MDPAGLGSLATTEARRTLDRKLHSLLLKQRAAIVERWLEKVHATYPEDSSRFLVAESDRFANPVGQTLREAIGTLVDGFIEGAADDVAGSLDRIIRIRAVQDFTPSQALAFVFQLKEVVRELVPSSELSEVIDVLHRRIDELALAAFDIYMTCKEKIYEIRVNEMKNRTFKLVERMNRIYGTQE